MFGVVSSREYDSNVPAEVILTGSDTELVPPVKKVIAP